MISKQEVAPYWFVLPSPSNQGQACDLPECFGIRDTPRSVNVQVSATEGENNCEWITEVTVCKPTTVDIVLFIALF